MRLNNAPGYGAAPIYSAPPVYDAQNHQNDPDRPVTPSKVVPLILGFFFGLFGVLLAVLTYNGNYGKYTSNPTVNALLWSIIGTLIQIPIIAAVLYLLVIPLIQNLTGM